VEWLKSTNLQFSRCYNDLRKFRKWCRHCCTLWQHPFRISADTNKDDVECPIRRKVRLADGTLDVCMLWLSELTMRDWMNMGLQCKRQKMWYIYNIIILLWKLLITQRQIILKDVCGYNNARKLHRPRMSDTFLGDTVTVDTIWL